MSLAGVESQALGGELLPLVEKFCVSVTENLSPTRAVKYALEQRDYLDALARAVGAAVAPDALAGRPEVRHVVCLGGIGVSAVAARQRLAPPSRVSSVHPAASRDTAWQMLGARMVAFANGFVDTHCLVEVPEEPWDLLVVEGLDTFALSDGVLPMMRRAAPHAAAGARVIPGSARLRAFLCAPRDFDAVAGGFHGGFDLRAVCGRDQLAATVPWLMIDEDNALLDDHVRLTETFDAMTLWDTDAAERDVLLDLSEIPEVDSASAEVTCTAAGLCAAVLFWWETGGPDCKSGMRAVQWLPQPRRVEPGDRVTVTASRSLTRVQFALGGGSAQVDANLSLASLRHCPMLRDDARNEAYGRAIERAVRLAKERDGRAAVLEIGSGTGLLMMMAKRAGADKVTGCEVDPHVSALASRVAADNGVPFDGRGGDFDLLPASFQALLQDTSMRGQYNVLVAELMDDSGLGESIWPFFALAHRYLLAPGAEPFVLPRKLTLFAALVAVEVAPIGGAQVWPLDPFWYCSAVPNLDAIGRRSGQMSLDLDRYEEHWEAVSDVVEVLSVDLAQLTLEGVKQYDLGVQFECIRSGVMNGVVWFWHAELDDENSVVTAPRRLWDARGHRLPRGASRGSRHCWKQACQALGPTWVERGQSVKARARHDTINVRWELEGFDAHDMAGSMPLHKFWEEQRGLVPDLVLEMNDFVRAWLAAVAAPEQSKDDALRLWRQRLQCGESELASAGPELIGLLSRLGDFGLHPTAANVAVPHFFGSITAGAYHPA